MKRKDSNLLFILSCAVLTFASANANAALVFNTNVILDPGAEDAVGSVKNDTVVPVPFWTLTAGNFTAVKYLNDPNVIGVPQLTDPGPPNRGVNLFAGGPNGNPNQPNFISSADQILDISNAAASIDTGLIPFDLSGYLGGFFDQRDNATFTAFFNNGMTTLGSSTLGPVLLADRTFNGVPVTGLFFRSATGFIPSGTRQIDFRIVSNGIDGAQNDGYLDNLSFIARGPAAVPEPGSMGLIAAGLAGLGFYWRRKGRSSQNGQPSSI